MNAISHTRIALTLLFTVVTASLHLFAGNPQQDEERKVIRGFSLNQIRVNSLLVQRLVSVGNQDALIVWVDATDIKGVVKRSPAMGDDVLLGVLVRREGESRPLTQTILAPRTGRELEQFEPTSSLVRPLKASLRRLEPGAYRLDFVRMEKQGETLREDKRKQLNYAFIPLLSIPMKVVSSDN